MRGVAADCFEMQSCAKALSRDRVAPDAVVTLEQVEDFLQRVLHQQAKTTAFERNAGVSSPRLASSARRRVLGSCLESLRSPSRRLRGLSKAKKWDAAVQIAIAEPAPISASASSRGPVIVSVDRRRCSAQMKGF